MLVKIGATPTAHPSLTLYGQDVRIAFMDVAPARCCIPTPWAPLRFE